MKKEKQQVDYVLIGIILLYWFSPLIESWITK